MILQWLTAKEHFSPFELQNSIQVLLDLLIIPGKNWPNGQVLQTSSASLLSHLLEQARPSPVFMHEHDRLSRALLASMGVSVLVASVCNEVDIFLPTRHVRSENFPIVSTVFKSNLASERFDKVLSHS